MSDRTTGRWLCRHLDSHGTSQRLSGALDAVAQNDRYQRFGSHVCSYAVLDSIIHNAIPIDIGGNNMREKIGAVQE